MLETWGNDWRAAWHKDVKVLVDSSLNVSRSHDAPGRL